jgi:hypothetical protein
MKNNVSDLNDILFTQLSRLSNEEIQGDLLKQEIDRSKAITEISTQIISNAKLVVEARKVFKDSTPEETPDMLRIKSE